MACHQHIESVLPGFSEARKIIKAAENSVFPLQYKGSKFDFYRFANRYRMAVRFSGIVLDDFADSTTDGYSALTRVFFTWSVFNFAFNAFVNPSLELGICN